jgi:hypothetical protein
MAGLRGGILLTLNALGEPALEAIKADSVLSSLGTSASVLLSGVLCDFNPTLPFYIATVM